MSFDIVRGIINEPQQANILIKKIEEYITKTKDSGTLYLGYPLTAKPNSRITIDALLVTRKKGMLAFIFGDATSSFDTLKEEQDALYFHFDYYLKKYDSLRKGRNLAFSPIIITFLPITYDATTSTDGYYFADSENILNVINNTEKFDIDMFVPLCEALQKVTNIRPSKKRNKIMSDSSLGFIIKEIEKEMANLDEWQKKAALEVPDGPQRIRGLAGTGKTIILALKAAYLHTHFPDWHIVVTYFTRSLKQQYEELIRKFVNDFSGEEPDWDNLEILHAWGSKNENGFYYNLTNKIETTPYTLISAFDKFGNKNPFNGMCDELLTLYGDMETIPTYDAILIDEAQDFPSSFFKLALKDLKKPKRIIWAYDELQNLTDMEMPSLIEMFGQDEDGEVLINIENQKDQPQRDIILPVCYRNPPWTLATAHALGFGIYNQKRQLPIQMFDSPKIWEDVGYTKKDGRLGFGSNVRLERSTNSSPKYFDKLLKKNESIKMNCFDTKEQQYAFVANEINKNLTVDELEPDDILVIFPDSVYSKREYNDFCKYLQKYKINSFLAGVNAERNIFKIVDNITCSGIFRAKGNESPMVYILNADFCTDGTEVIKLRNILFTAITRSRAWVRICGSGENIKLLKHEFDKAVENDYELAFKIPSKKDMEKIRKLNREKTEEEKLINTRANNSVDELINLITRDEVDLDLLQNLDTLINVIKKKG